jgi:hypothetical protein
MRIGQLEVPDTILPGTANELLEKADDMGKLVSEAAAALTTPAVEALKKMAEATLPEINNPLAGVTLPEVKNPLADMTMPSVGINEVDLTAVPYEVADWNIESAGKATEIMIVVGACLLLSCCLGSYFLFKGRAHSYLPGG